MNMPRHIDDFRKSLVEIKTTRDRTTLGRAAVDLIAISGTLATWGLSREELRPYYEAIEEAFPAFKSPMRWGPEDGVQPVDRAPIGLLMLAAWALATIGEADVWAQPEDIGRAEAIRQALPSAFMVQPCTLLKEGSGPEVEEVSA